MESLLGDLGELLAAQVENLKSLEALLRNQHSALAKRDVEAILESVSGQERCLEKIQAMEADRSRLVREISDVLGLGPRGVTLKELTQHLDPEVGTELRSTGRAIRETLERIGTVNLENRRLIEHSLGFVREMLGALTGTGSAKRTYEPSGHLKPDGQRYTLVDQVT